MKRKKNAGSTMVEVIVAFAVLAIVLACFAEITSLCLKMTVSSVNTRTETEERYAQFYSEPDHVGIQLYPESGNTAFSFRETDGDGTAFFSVEGRLSETVINDAPVYYYEE